MTNKKKYTIVNPVMFAMVMENKDLCIDLLKLIFPNRVINDIRYADKGYLETEKTIIPGIEAKAVRLDVLFETEDSWNDIELQASDEPELPKRCRYYHSAMDIVHLHSGETYDKLKASYVIFICRFDYFGLDEPIYSFQPVDENLGLPLGDESYTIVLNTECSEKKIPTELEPLFQYIKTGKLGTIKDSFIKRLDKAVEDINAREGVYKFMTLEEHYKIREKYLNEKFEKQKEELEKQFEKQKEENERKERESAKKMKLDGVPAEKIAEYTGLSAEEIEAL